MISLNDVLNPVSKENYELSIYNVLAAVGANTTSWKAGAVVRTIIVAMAICCASLHKLIALVARGAFVETAFGVWLTLCARYVFGVRREPATHAAGAITLVNGGGGVYEFEADELVVSNPDTGKSYRNSAPFVLGALETETFPFVAIESGSGSTSVTASIIKIEAPAMPGVTCSNAAPFVGQDEEGDATLKARCYEKLGSLSPNGPWDAYTFAARNAKRADGTRVGVTRVKHDRDGFGNLFLYVATPTGPVLGDASDIATDLGAVFDAIQRRATPLCVTSHAIGATPRSIGITYTAYLTNTSGRTEEEIKTIIAAKLAQWMANEPIGGRVLTVEGFVFTDTIAAVIRSALPQIYHVVIHSPGSHTAMGVHEVPVLGSVVPTIVQRAPSDAEVFQ